MDNSDVFFYFFRGFGNFDTGVGGNDFRVVPGLDFAEKDLGQGFPRQLDLDVFQAFDVHHRHNAADHSRELEQTIFVQVFRFQGGIGSAELNRAGLDLANAATGSDGLIVDLVTGCLVVHVCPGCVYRIRERSAGTIQGFAGSYGNGRNSKEQCKHQCFELHVHLLQAT